MKNNVLQVYGVAQARIAVGYQYSSCPAVVWETQTATLQGFDVDISDVGGWSLDIHHHYNFHEGNLLQNTFRLRYYGLLHLVVLQIWYHCSEESDGSVIKVSPDKGAQVW
jgi:hypothetical protein